MSIKKIFAGTLAAVTIFSFAGASLLSPAPVNAATAEELQAQVTALLAQIAALQGGSSSSCYTFTTDLTIGSTGEAVKMLQMWLNKKGFTVAASGAGSAGMESTYFGAMTQAALAKYQASAGISPAAGYFGPITRAKVNAECTTTGGGSGTGTGSTGLEGGAGSVDSYELVSGLNNEEVGEDESDAEVAGLEIEVDDGSDIRLTAVRLVLDESSASTTSDFEDYAEEVSLWLDGEEIAREDADEFTDDNDWTKTISIDEDAVINAGETGELTVAVSGASSIDSDDEGDGWTVDFRQIRFVDADGATISEDPTTAVRTFTFESFASATNVEMKIALNDADDDVNEAHVIDIDDTDTTDDVEILSFTIENDGDSDIVIDEIPVLFTGVGFNLDVGLSGTSLWMDGDEIASENFSASATTSSIEFEDLDITVEAGEEIELVVSVDIEGTDTTIDNGDTIAAEIGATQRAAIDAEDESGEDVESNDRTGTAVGEASALYDEGIMVEFVSADADVTVLDSTNNDQGVFEIVVKVSAFDGDFYLDNSLAQSSSTSATPAGSHRVAAVTSAGAVTTTTGMTIAQVGNVADDGTNGFFIEDGETATFEINLVAVSPDASVRGILYGLEWGVDDEATMDFVYTFNMGVAGDFKTGFVFVND